MGPVVNGIADIHGIPKEVLRAFSTRREEIEARMALRGDSSPRAAEIAALDTRKAKDRDVDPDQLRRQWADKATGLGYGPDRLGDLMNRTRTRQTVPDPPGEAARIEQLMLGPEGLTARASMFDRRDVLRALSAAYPQGASVRLVEAHADMFLGHAEVVKVLDMSSEALRNDAGRTVSRVGLGARYSTRELLALEQRLVMTAMARRSDRFDFTPQPAVDGALANRPSLSAEQRRLVAIVTMGCSGVDVVTAPAGAGKTFALAAANDAWTAGGHRVIGAALSARAGAELQASAAIPSMTLARLAMDVTVINRGDVVVIDEFGMAPTRLVAPIFDRAAEVGAKLVLVGDPRQLPEIGAGGLLAGLTARLPAVELVENRRQRNTWEQLALAELRAGRIEQALGAYKAHDRIIALDTASDTKTRLVDDWATARALGADVIMLASRNVDIDDLNTLARTKRLEHGALTGAVLTIETAGRVREFQAGDEIMMLRNDRRFGVTNAMRATVTDVHEHSNIAMSVVTTAGQRKSIPSWYVENGTSPTATP